MIEKKKKIYVNLEAIAYTTTALNSYYHLTKWYTTLTTLFTVNIEDIYIELFYCDWITEVVFAFLTNL